MQQMPLFASDASAGQAGGAAPRSAGHAAGVAGAPVRLCVLGSGSGGNCTVVQVPPRDAGPAMLIDAGFGPRTTARRLAQAGLSLAHVQAICLTHLDRDHFRPSWVPVLIERGIAVHVHRWHASELRRLPGAGELHAAGLLRRFGERAFDVLAGVRARPMRCQHDRQGTIAYRFEVESAFPPSGRGRGRVSPTALRHEAGADAEPQATPSPLSKGGGVVALGYATDLGHVPEALIEHFAGVDVLAIEANYDPFMTVHSPRPTFVNRRNMSDSGHLSNEQALAAVRRIDAVSGGGNPRHVLLMHRSRQCNHPTKLRRAFEAEPALARRVRLTEQRRRTGWLTVRPLPAVRGRQMMLAGCGG